MMALMTVHLLTNRDISMITSGGCCRHGGCECDVASALLTAIGIEPQKPPKETSLKDKTMTAVVIVMMMMTVVKERRRVLQSLTWTPLPLYITMPIDDIANFH